MFFINNTLRDKVYRNNLLHGFWDNIRTYQEFVDNLFGEFDETMTELESGIKPTEVYFKKGNKPEGVPTELADIVIFILDYFGGSEPKIDVDEEFLQTSDKYYKNLEYYEEARKENPIKYFSEIEKICKNLLSISLFRHSLHGNGVYENEDGSKSSVPLILHEVIKRILEVCEVWGIDFEKELNDKIEYNNSRPKDYRKMGSGQPLDTNPHSVFCDLLRNGWGAYKETENVCARNAEENDKVARKRAERKRLEQGDLQQ